MTVTNGGAKPRYTGYIFFFLMVLLVLGGAGISAAQTNCKITAAGDHICDNAPAAKKPAPEAARKTPPPPSGAGPLTTGSSPLMTGETAQPADNSIEKLKTILASLPDVIENALLDESLSYFEQNSDTAKRTEQLKKLTALSKKVRELTEHACGVTDSTKADTQQYIHNSLSTSVQFANITEKTPAEMDAYLDELGKDLCQNLQPPPVPTDDQAGGQSSQYNGDDAITSNNRVLGSGYSNYNPDDDMDVDEGSYDSGSSSATGNFNYPTCKGDAAGEGGEKIAAAAKGSVGTVTSGIPGTQGGNLACAAAVSIMLNCAGYSPGKHLSTITLYNHLAKDKCYETLFKGQYLGNLPLQPGDILVTKRKSGGRAGHTGIYVGNGVIVHNNSKPGVIKDNQDINRWSSIIGRNPPGSAVFRRKPNCS